MGKVNALGEGAWGASELTKMSHKSPWHGNAKCILCIVELHATVNNVKILEVLPWKFNTVFPVYRWATSCCQEHKLLSAATDMQKMDTHALLSSYKTLHTAVTNVKVLRSL